jgi:hypothetical protein
LVETRVIVTDAGSPGAWSRFAAGKRLETSGQPRPETAPDTRHSADGAGHWRGGGCRRRAQVPRCRGPLPALRRGPSRDRLPCRSQGGRSLPRARHSTAGSPTQTCTPMLSAAE